MKRLVFFLLFALRAFATDHFVDSTATGTGTGATWVNAWTNVSAVSASPGDIVYISGGPTGQAQTYARTTEWNPPSGNSSARITYKIGQDSLHNGTAIFDGAGGPGTLLTQTSYINFIGDAGDGAQHFRLINFYRAAESFSHARIAYLYCDDSDMWEFLNAVAPGGTATTGIEIDHNYVRISNVTADHAIYFGSAGTNRTDSLFHHNRFVMPYLGAGFGIDGIQAGSAGYSIYDNVFEGYYLPSYVGGQHQDGFQVQWGSKVSVYNNRFINMSNYGIFLEDIYGYWDVYVYNNEVSLTDPQLRDGAVSPAGIVCGVAADNTTMSNVIIANNVITGYKPDDPSSGMSLSNSNNRTGTTWVNCRLQNNLQINGPNSYGAANAPTIASGNVYLTTTQAFAQLGFVADAGLTNNFRPSSAATSIIGQGADLSAYFTSDADGATRSVPWDAGPYKYASSAISGTPRFPLFQRQPRR